MPNYESYYNVTLDYVTADGGPGKSGFFSSDSVAVDYYDNYYKGLKREYYGGPRYRIGVTVYRIEEAEGSNKRVPIKNLSL